MSWPMSTKRHLITPQLDELAVGTLEDVVVIHDLLVIFPFNSPYADQAQPPSDQQEESWGADFVQEALTRAWRHNAWKIFFTRHFYRAEVIEPCS